MLDASWHAAHGDAELVADEGGGGAVSVRSLHQAKLELGLQPCLKQNQLCCEHVNSDKTLHLGQKMLDVARN